MRTSRRTKRVNAAPRPSSSTPTPAELIRFCKDAGLDILGADVRRKIGAIKTTADYDSLVKQLTTNRRDSLEDQLRIALNLWTDVTAAAERVIGAARVPANFSKDTRLQLRWLRSQKLPVPKHLEDDAVLRWEISLGGGKAVSEAGALRILGSRFKTERGVHNALRSFGCPSGLGSALTDYAVKQLKLLDDHWVKAQNAGRSKKRRARASKTKSP